MNPWKNPMLKANFKELTVLFLLNTSPCEKDTIKQSIPSAIASKIMSIKLNFHLKQSVPWKLIFYFFLQTKFIKHNFFKIKHFFFN